MLMVVLVCRMAVGLHVVFVDFLPRPRHRRIVLDVHVAAVVAVEGGNGVDAPVHEDALLRVAKPIRAFVLLEDSQLGSKVACARRGEIERRRAPEKVINAAYWMSCFRSCVDCDVLA